MREQQLAGESVTAIEWRDGALHVLDQRALPQQTLWCRYSRWKEVVQAVQDEVVQGAPLLASCFAYALVLALRERLREGEQWHEGWLQDWQALAEQQPADGSLAWVLKLMRECLQRLPAQQDALSTLEAQAAAVQFSTMLGVQNMARLGLALLRGHQAGEQSMLVHGPAALLAGAGGPLAVLQAAFANGLLEQVYLEQPQAQDSTSRLTAWELAQHGIVQSHYSMAANAQLLKVSGITWIIVGAQRIAANGDLLNTVGTYQLAVNAMHHGVRLMVVADSALIDLTLEHGDDAPLDEFPNPDQSALEEGVGMFMPQLDVTPADFIDFLVTEKGVIERPDGEKIAQLLCRKRLH